MSKSEIKWRKFYLYLMIFIYAVYTPITVFEWIIGEDGFPFTAVVIGFSLPLMRANHIHTIREKQHR
ncbi:hypothetical protein [Ornithinibacillus scapharcae]|uniref:hypothetical protein n=1 Tax=Ornithinibacillus scapharcae TaxID=1147159 RepID=UPI000225B3F3|nr:hypothetical protein [Ornithinibacillus scapharcae]